MLRFLATLKIAARALCRNKLRTVLTMLGMIIGVGAVIAMVSIGNGAKSQIEAQIASMGENVVLVFAGNVSRGGARSGWGWAATLKIEDAEAIEREIPGVAGLSPEIRTRTQVAAGNQNWYTTIQGESPDYFEIRQWPLIAGAGFSEQDVRGATKVAVIGHTVADQLFPDQDPIGQVVRIKKVPFTVVGLLHPKGFSVQGLDQDDFIAVPYTSAMKRVQRVTTLGSIVVQAANPSAVNFVQQQITGLLRQRHKITPGKEDDFTVRNQQEIADAAIAESETMTALLLGVAIISLVVGGIGIMNIMLVSVTERTREIGIRVAIGARRQDILLQFLVEAVTLGVIGGLAGICSGTLASKIIVARWHWSAFIPPEWILLSFLISAAVGVFSGFYPARKASQLDPIDALRYE